MILLALPGVDEHHALARATARLGVDLACALDLDEAMEIARHAGPRLHAVICDAHMGGRHITGFLRALRELAPRPVIVMHDADPDDPIVPFADRVHRAPFTPDSLQAAVREVLGPAHDPLADHTRLLPWAD